MSAPKQLAKRRNLERKRQRKQQAKLKRQRKRQGRCNFDEGILFGPVDRVSGEKMSDILAEFVRPFDGWVQDVDDYEQLAMAGVAAWNIALASEPRRREMLDELDTKVLAAESEENRAAFRELLNHLVARKEQFFNGYRRHILSFVVEDLGDDYHLMVASTLY